MENCNQELHRQNRKTNHFKDRTRTAVKCTEVKNARAKRGKCEYANLWRSCLRGSCNPYYFGLTELALLCDVKFYMGRV